MPNHGPCLSVDLSLPALFSVDNRQHLPKAAIDKASACGETALFLPKRRPREVVRTHLSQQVIGRVFSLAHNLALSTLYLMESCIHSRDLNNLGIHFASKFERRGKARILSLRGLEESLYNRLRIGASPSLTVTTRSPTSTDEPHLLF